MITNEDILKLETRKEIYNFIEKNPGLHLREISRNMNISFGNLRYHLNFLEKQNLIRKKESKRYTRYYITKQVSKRDKEILNLLRQDVPRQIILLLLTPGPGKIYQSRYTMNRSLNNPLTFSKTYSKKDLIELTKHWDGPVIDKFKLRKNRTTIDFHLKKLQDIDLIETVKIGKEIKYKLRDDETVWYPFLIKYKKALGYDTVGFFLTWHNSAVEHMTDKVINKIWDVFPHPYHV